MDVLGRQISRFRVNALGSSQLEKACFAKLVESYRLLEKTDGRIETRTENGHDSCQAFLHTVQTTIQTLGIDPAARRYRSSFTSNYRFLFPDDGLHYRIDVFEASIERHPVIWVNGDKFEFSVNTMTSAETLQQAFAELNSLLDVDAAIAQAPTRQILDELRSLLKRLDGYWANFEKGYICELIAIEAKARSLIVHAVEQERLLEQAEKEQAFTSTNIQQMRKELIKSIARLNSVANNRRKGRDDLDQSILEDALMQLQLRSQGEIEEASAACLLARDIVESFEAIRLYFRNVSKCLERVDPHLCNNVGLVERLVDWEESWEVGAKYVRHTPLLLSVVDVVAELRQVEQVAPQLKAMCDDCDVELFLCIPRILWLRFLEEPSECRELLRSLLPHHFGPQEAVGDELRGLLDRFEQTHQLMSKFCSSEHRSHSCAHAKRTSPFVWELLVRRAVTGSADSDTLYFDFAPHAHAKAVREAVEHLMNELEKWSMELQRHSPEDWNQCSSLLVRCLMGNMTERTTQEFHV
jgi:hypothetical protein